MNFATIGVVMRQRFEDGIANTTGCVKVIHAQIIDNN